MQHTMVAQTNRDIIPQHRPKNQGVPNFWRKLANLVLVWILIGERSSGVINKSSWIGLLIGIFKFPSTHSKLSNITKMLHGMKIHFSSSRLAGVGSFIPSNIDLISVKNFFISTITIGTERRLVNFENSRIRLYAHLKGMTLSSSTIVRPMMNATGSNIIQQKRRWMLND